MIASCRRRIFGRNIVKGAPCHSVRGLEARQRLPAPDADVHVARIKFDAPAASAGTLCGDQRRAAAEKGIDDNVPSSRAIQQCIGDERHGLYGWMKREKISLFRLATERVRPSVAPDIRPMPSVLPQLDVVLVRRLAVFED